ncbi:MAG: type I methionyl aminopeptidase [Candidatus Pacebacteria bacterium]|nr:type I methionyl aminopeptidase [Candidatus Paceibacterota bacterium]PIR60511.1 MAG: type I methionyl aminopeptidase [Candidatus Pacebacteria bacterium CG10_big_fil_rev_8_21_14_0_10_44_54]
MRQGGRILAQIRDELERRTVPGTTFEEIESWAQALLKKHKVVASFSSVPGYSWATCVMRNDALCHGIPQQDTIQSGDVVTIDIGLLNKGYHLDTTTSFIVGEAPVGTQEFLAVGKKSLAAAIAKVRSGASVYAVSKAMQRVLDTHGFGAIYQLTGHGIGEKLHMEPSIPVVANKSDEKVFFSTGQTVAIEVMYAAGDPELKLAKDNWTYRTKDGSLSAMFEETVLVTEFGHEVLTKSL